MCGRDTLFHTWRDVWAFSRPLMLDVPEHDPEPTWNRAPTDPGWVIVATREGGEVRSMRWGLVPPWAKDTRIGYSTINARVETVATKPAFRAAFRQRRCLVPSSGYYEWKAERGHKQPYFIHAADAPLLFFAGVWERWQREGETPLLSYSILTGPADEAVAELHARQPLILPATRFGDWLHGSTDQATALLHALPPPHLAFHPVRRTVGNARANGPELVEPLPAGGEADL